MADQFLAEIRIFGFTFAPRDWAFCDGQLLQISQNQSLYALLGTTYGGDGRTTFGLPDLRGRAAMHKDGPHPLGQKAGEETHVLSVGEIPSHTHEMMATSANANASGPAGNLLAQTPTGVGEVYSGTSTTLDKDAAASAIANAGSNQGHPNMQPYLTLNFCIAIRGLFPSRN